MDSASANVPTQDAAELFDPCARGDHGTCPCDVFVQHPRATAGLPTIFGAKPGRREICKCPCHNAVDDPEKIEPVAVVRDEPLDLPAVDPLAFEEPAAPTVPATKPTAKTKKKTKTSAPDAPGLFG